MSRYETIESFMTEASNPFLPFIKRVYMGSLKPISRHSQEIDGEIGTLELHKVDILRGWKFRSG